MNGALEHRWRENAEQARRDLADLDRQMAAGEIDEEAGNALRSAYEQDLRQAERRLSEMGTDEPATRSRGRLLVGAGLLALGLAVAVGLVASFVEARDDGSLVGVASNPEFDPADYSNETLEGVLASVDNDPQALRATLPMRFQLAERYFTESEFTRAFEHYEFIINSDPDPGLASAALTRVAWIVWVGNGLTDLALDTIDQALAADPSNLEATYVKGQLLWCGRGDPEAAVPLFRQVLESDSIDDAVRDQVALDLEAASASAACG